MRRIVLLSTLAAAIAVGVTLLGQVLKPASDEAMTARDPQPMASAGPPLAHDLVKDPGLAFALIEPIFDTLDCDSGGTIDRAEVDEHFGQLFRPRDADRSRGLSVAEYAGPVSGSQRKQREAVFPLLDGDRDGALSVSEYRKHLYAMVELLDANQDGDVTRQELASTRPPGYANRARSPSARPAGSAHAAD